MISSIDSKQAAPHSYRLDALGNVAGATLAATAATFGAVLAKRMDAPSWVVSVCVAAMFVPSVLAWLVPLLGRRLPMGGVIMGLRLLGGLAMVPCVFAPSLAMFLAGYIIAFTCIGLADYAYPTLLRVLYRPDAQRTMFSLIYALRSLVMFIIFIALGWWLDNLSVNDGFRLVSGLGVVLGVISAGATLPIRRVRDETVDAAPRDTADSPWANRMFLRYLLILTVFGIGNAAILVLWPIMAVKSFTFSNTQIGLLQALCMLAQLGAFAWFNRHGRVAMTLRIVGWPIAAFAAPCLAAVLLLQTGAGAFVAFPAMLAAYLLLNFGSGIWTMYFYLLVNEMAEPASSLPYHAIQGTVVGARGLVVPFLVSLFFERFALLPSLLLTMAFFLSASLIAWLSPRQFPRRRLAQEEQPPVVAVQPAAESAGV